MELIITIIVTKTMIIRIIYFSKNNNESADYHDINYDYYLNNNNND